MRGSIADHLQPGKFLLTSWAFEIPRRAIFDNALNQTFHQAAVPTFVVFVQQRLALGAVDGNRPNVAFGHEVTTLR